MNGGRPRCPAWSSLPRASPAPLPMVPVTVSHRAAHHHVPSSGDSRTPPSAPPRRQPDRGRRAEPHPHRADTGQERGPEIVRWLRQFDVGHPPGQLLEEDADLAPGQTAAKAEVWAPGTETDLRTGRPCQVEPVRVVKRVLVPVR